MEVGGACRLEGRDPGAGGEPIGEGPVTGGPAPELSLSITLIPRHRLCTSVKIQNSEIIITLNTTDVRRYQECGASS